jgi:hypothetical protein
VGQRGRGCAEERGGDCSACCSIGGGDGGVEKEEL